MPKEEKDFIKNLNKPDMDIKSKFVVSEMTMKTSARGNQYLNVTLTDKTGQFDGVMFDNVEEIYDKINVGSVCQINGKIDEFPKGSGRFNMKIYRIDELDETQYQYEDFKRISVNDVDDSLEFIASTIDSIENHDLKNLLNAFFSDENFLKEFSKAPAAIVHHHNYEGGLLDHTIEVLKLSKTTTELFPDLDNDLLYAGVLLHDLGKMKTYTYGNRIGYSDEGYMLDHIYLSCEMVREKMDSVETPRELAIKVLHMILSHHGDVSLGWGSSVDPKTPEALALHYADNLDAKVKKSLH
jgi:3'-5' exoribonuclease